MSTDVATVALTLAAVAGLWLLLCSAVAVGVFLGMLTLHGQVTRQEQAAAQAQEPAQ